MTADDVLRWCDGMRERYPRQLPTTDAVLTLLKVLSRVRVCLDRDFKHTPVTRESIEAIAEMVRDQVYRFPSTDYAVDESEIVNVVIMPYLMLNGRSLRQWMWTAEPEPNPGEGAEG